MKDQWRVRYGHLDDCYSRFMDVRCVANMLISDLRPRKWRPIPTRSSHLHPRPERCDGDCRSSNSCQGNLTIGTCWDAVPEYGCANMPDDN
ncbi:hypothetical protein QQF64_024783 [Cirrhinus molitorella]|uniref:Uncharacterized protein n=1 Tax=Cirrhinus molitorella TaxID=172907 RepID=A0ABR3NNH0_9TELE